MNLSSSLGVSISPSKALVLVSAGLTPLVLLLPHAVLHSNPPICYSMFWYVVPCGIGHEASFSLAVSAVGVVGAWAFLGRESRHAPTPMLEVLVPVAVGLVTVVLLAPHSISFQTPPTCYSMFRYVVPCGIGITSSFALGVSATAAVGAWVVVHMTTAVSRDGRPMGTKSA